MTIEAQLDLVGAIAIFFGGLVPGYLSFRLKGDMAKLTIVLTVFIVVHGIYHLVRMQGMESIADGIFEPASVIVLIAFGVSFLVVAHRKNELRRKQD
jgi:hypothetical protein